MLIRIQCLAIGYVFGLFQTAYIIGRLHHTDIRRHGSGNAGTTNALRTFGKKAGALTLLGDVLKCFLAMLLVSRVFRGSHGEILPLLTMYTGFGCILGHNFPFYLNFRGGKGIGASAGLILFFDWKIFLVGVIAVFGGILATTHYVSLGSLSAYVISYILIMIRGQMGAYGMDQAHLTELYLVVGAMTILAFVRHRANIKRLLSGTENKIYLGKKKDPGTVSRTK